MIPVFKGNRFPSPLGEGREARRRRLGVRSNLTKRQIEVTMFACGVEKLEGLKVGKMVKFSQQG